MSLALVTGVAGFIGSRLALRLLEEGYAVRGVDCFTDYYDCKLKERNISLLQGNPNFTLLRENLCLAPEKLLDGAELVFHQAAQPGVRSSWGRDFAVYTRLNILAAQELLEAARRAGPVRFIFASSSSVYGEAKSLPMHEEDLPQPISPYGVSKLAAEHLCRLYYHNFGVPTVSLRYFTVYGPGQRPDMAFHRFIRALLKEEALVVYGNGEQTRDFTYIDDIVEANLAAAQNEEATGGVFNIGGGSRVSINEVIRTLGEIGGKELRVEYRAAQEGDPGHTYADTLRARAVLGFQPRYTLREGLALQLKDMEALLGEGL